VYSYSLKKSSIGCFSADGSKTIVPLINNSTDTMGLYNVYDNRSGMKENIRPVRVVHESVANDLLFMCGQYIIGIDCEKAMFSVSNTSRSSDNQGIPIVISAFLKRPRKIEKYCLCTRMSLLFYSAGQKLYVLNLTNSTCSKVKYDISSFESFEKKTVLSNATISSMTCHPVRPLITITLLLANGSSLIAFLNFSSLLAKISTTENDEDMGDGESVSDTASVVSSVAGQSTFPSKSKKLFDVVGQMLIKPPTSNPASKFIIIFLAGSLG
jgi:hypothetical protein